jgi:alkylhydroperoxidase/carboxymuconolactone decarboxylase family protein YurZ
MSEHPLKIYERLDPELLRQVEENRKFALAGGTLPEKFKCLLVMALDAAQGSPQGVRANASAALQAGATKEEIQETLRITHYICGAGTVYLCAQALENMF